MESPGHQPPAVLQPGVQPVPLHDAFLSEVKSFQLESLLSGHFVLPGWHLPTRSMCPTSGRFSWGMGIQYFSVDWRWRDHDQGQSNLLVADCGQQKYISLYNSTVQSSGDIRDIPKHNLVPQHVSSILVTSRLNKLVPGSEQQQVVDNVSEPWAVALCDHEWEYFLLTINKNDLWQSDIFLWHIYL